MRAICRTTFRVRACLCIHICRAGDLKFSEKIKKDSDCAAQEATEVLPCVEDCCSVFQYGAVLYSVVQCCAVWCSAVQCTAFYCNVLLCVAVCHSVFWQRVLVC